MEKKVQTFVRTYDDDALRKKLSQLSKTQNEFLLQSDKDRE